MISIKNLSIDLGEFHLKDVCLDIKKGEYMVLLGPTGAGKTVLVECIAGLFDPPTGSILVDGHDVVGLYPEERNIGYVPQDYALFPNMTVAKNIAYGLEARKIEENKIAEIIREMMEMLGITHLSHRYPLNLSGGERQRVALARALVTKPDILLLDEPLSALDENLRSELAAELLQIQRKSGATFLHVCHSFEEASDVADRIAIMKDGEVAQVGTIMDVVFSPDSLFIARFTRMRNFFDGTLEGSKLKVGSNWDSIGKGDLPSQGDFPGETALPGEGDLINKLNLFFRRVDLSESQISMDDGAVVISIRPEDIEVLDSSVICLANHGFITIEGTLKFVRIKLTHQELFFEGIIPLIVHVDRKAQTVKIGKKVMLKLPAYGIRLFHKE